jgi:predicted metal-dependent HD superfamily phosphohydrolase
MSADSPTLALADRWTALLRPLGVEDAAAEAAFNELARRYAEPHRRYHTLDHIAQLLAVLDPHLPGTTDPSALAFAAWLHDIVYDPRAADNEERSAALAAELLDGFPISPATMARTGELILLTKTHSADDADGQLLIDADLSILGAETAAYDRYAAAIREEYAWVPEPAYRTGRSAVLKSFLRRDAIFGTPALAARCEARARENLAREIDRLGAE